MQLLFLVALWLQVLTPAWGYGTGAPALVCDSMSPNHGDGVTAQSAASPFTIIPNTTTFRNGQAITVLINGSDYVGVLLQARSGTGTSALGTWGTAPTNTKLLLCSGNANGAITHTNVVTKNNLTAFTWTPPTSGDSVFFVATVAKSKAEYWVNVKSATLTRATGNTPTAPGSAADPKLTVASVLLLLPVLLMSGVQI